MSNFTIFKVFLAALLFVAASSSPTGGDEVLSTLLDLTFERFEFGENKEGARMLENTDFNKLSCAPELCNFTDKFNFPSIYTSSESLGKIITKIVVLVEKPNKEAEADAEIVDGGLEQKFVTINIDVKNSTRLHYRGIVYGVPSK